MKRFFAILLVSISVIGIFGHVKAQNQYSSSNYSVQAPVIFPGGYITSTNFGLVGVISQIAIGSSTSITYGNNSGFNYFPFISTPIVSATAGDAQVSVTWTSASGALGWTVSGYNVGRATVSGGPYNFSSLGNTLSNTQTGLTNGTTYYFIVQVKDSFGNVIATSTQVSATPVSSGGSEGGGGTGGGGGGGGGGSGGGTEDEDGSSTVIFTGRAYPRSSITLLKDAQVVSSTLAGADARFQITLSNINAGNFIFSIYGEDNQGRRSNLLSFPVSVTAGATTNVGGIFITPTIDVDKSQVKKGDNLAIFGQTTSNSEVTIQVNSEQEIFAKTNADTDGVYLYNLDSSPLEIGDHSTKAKSAFNGEISSFSKSVEFKVGNTNILKNQPVVSCNNIADVNKDCKVNLVDFSIVAFWYQRPNPPDHVDLKKDGIVNLIDFSLLAYAWTG